MKRNAALDALVCLLTFFILSFAFLLFGRENKETANETPDVSGKGKIPVSVNGQFEAVGNYPIAVTTTYSVYRGGQAELEMQGTPGKTYSIDVYYSSGKSTSSVFSPVKADALGFFGWTWRVPSNAAKGDFRIVVTSDDGYYQLYYTIV